MKLRFHTLEKHDKIEFSGLVGTQSLNEHPNQCGLQMKTEFWVSSCDHLVQLQMPQDGVGILHGYLPQIHTCSSVVSQDFGIHLSTLS